MKGRLVLAMAAVGSLAVAGCSSSSSSSAAGGGSTGGGSTGGAASTKSCVASIGFEGPITGPVAPLGTEQLHFAQLAVLTDNLANKTKIKLVQGDTQLQPAQATTVTQQFISNSSILAVVGPAGSQEVIAIGSPMARAGMGFITGSATAVELTTGKYPTFFRVVSKDSVQGPQDANYIVKTLKPKAIMIVDDQEAYSTGLVSAMTPVFQVAANAQQFGRNLAQQHKKAVIFGTDGLFSPGTFTINGSYVSSFGPDITAMPADAVIARAALQKFGQFGTFGPPVYAATHVIDEAIASVCKSGQTPSRSNVLAAIKKTNEPASILGQPISFDSHGDLNGGKFFLFKIDSAGKYKLIPSS